MTESSGCYCFLFYPLGISPKFIYGNLRYSVMYTDKIIIDFSGKNKNRAIIWNENCNIHMCTLSNIHILLHTLLHFLKIKNKTESKKRKRETCTEAYAHCLIWQKLVPFNWQKYKTWKFLSNRTVCKTPSKIA